MTWRECGVPFLSSSVAVVVEEHSHLVVVPDETAGLLPYDGVFRIWSKALFSLHQINRWWTCSWCSWHSDLGLVQSRIVEVLVQVASLCSGCCSLVVGFLWLEILQLQIAYRYSCSVVIWPMYKRNITYILEFRVDFWISLRCLWKKGSQVTLAKKPPGCLCVIAVFIVFKDTQKILSWPQSKSPYLSRVRTLPQSTNLNIWGERCIFWQQFKKVK